MKLIVKMSSFTLNIAYQFIRDLIELLSYLEGVRANSPALKVLLWPVVYALTFVRVIASYLVFGGWKFYNVSMPYNILTTRNHFFSATPMSIYCFNKRGFALLLVEMVFFFYLMAVPVEKPVLILPYLVFKVVLTSVPFLALTPVQRLPF